MGRSGKELGRNGANRILLLFGAVIAASATWLGVQSVAENWTEESIPHPSNPKDKDRYIPSRVDEKILWQQPTGYLLKDINYPYQETGHVSLFHQVIDPSRMGLGLIDIGSQQEQDRRRNQLGQPNLRLPSFLNLEQIWPWLDGRNPISLFPGPSYRQGILTHPVKNYSEDLQLPPDDIFEPETTRALIIIPDKKRISISNSDPGQLQIPGQIVIVGKNPFGKENWLQQRARTIAYMDSGSNLNVLTFTQATRKIVTGYLESVGIEPNSAINLSGGRAAGLVVNGVMLQPTAETTRHALYTYPI